MYRSKKQPWITDNIINMCNNRRSLKKTKYQSEEHAEEYKWINNMIPNSMKLTKNDCLRSQCKSIDTYLKNGIHNKRAQIRNIENDYHRRQNVDDRLLMIIPE